MNPIVITSCPLSVKKEEIFKMATPDSLLESAIKAYSKKMTQKGLETFEHYQNVIITEKGYFMAFYQSDLNHT